MTVSAIRPVIVHAHFYQPPREDPWLDLLEREPGAAPFHDWNERIERECYRPVTAARLQTADGRIQNILNTLAWISFNAGPTLLEWLEHAAPDTYGRFLEADRVSTERLGHGNALAMPYHHVILPLASRRDKRTEVRWGIADFRRRFGREPEGMWLPETAVDDDTLDVLAEAGIQFTLLAPHQVRQVPDDGMPGTYTTQNGRHIRVVVYDGPLSHQVAFGPLIRDGAGWLEALAANPARLTTIATDGETYGHHHAFGEMALATVIAGAARRGLAFTNPASVLAQSPAGVPISLVAPSAWSCSHGVERWRSDCGCRLEAEKYPSQEWRQPLREALEWLAGELHARFEREGPLLLGDHWAAREALEGQPPAPILMPAARELLEMERNALRMFTSCGWFFDDLSGIETIQCLRYAVRAIELAGDQGAALSEALGHRLAGARSNDPSVGTGLDLLRSRVTPSVPAAARVAAGHVAGQLFPWGVVEPDTGAWVVTTGKEDGLTLTDSRTGVSVDARGAVARGATGHLRFHVQLDDGSAHELGLEDLTESARAGVRAALASALFPDHLAAGLYALGLSGTEAVTVRLLELLHDNRDPPSMDPALLHGALDLLELDAASVPFDAQTLFWQLLSNGTAALRDALLPFAIRFGFAQDAFGTVEP